ncbi:MAG: LON peptidase substrate-binding domain-containing protein [Planctomycetota bacterium]
MEPLQFDPERFSGDLPLFPLPEAALLPGGLLPLHVFEPRYRALARDALAGERLIGMAVLEPGFEADYEGAPAIDPTVCLGRIVVEQQLPDGRWNLVLAGLTRAEVLSEDRSRAYRLARVRLIPDEPAPELDERLAARRLARYVGALPGSMVTAPERLAQASRLLVERVGEDVPLGPALDLVACGLTLEAPDRAALLRERQVARRFAKLVRALDRISERLGRRPEVSWRPPFSRQ